MVTHAYNSSTPEAEAGGIQIQGQLWLHRQFQTSLGYRVKPCLKKEENKGQRLSDKVVA
jgi:hypothetical protein